jgi:hypothetical protein
VPALKSVAVLRIGEMLPKGSFMVVFPFADRGGGCDAQHAG